MKIMRTPQIAERLLGMVLVAHDREVILGDLAEQFASRTSGKGSLQDRLYAHIWYWRQLRQSVGPSLRRRREMKRPATPPSRSPEKRRASMIDALMQDLRYAVRTLMREPGWTMATVLTLALAIGATTAIFTVVNAVLLRPLEYEDSNRLMVFDFAPVNDEAKEMVEGVLELGSNDSWFRFSTTWPSYEAWREAQTVFENIAVWEDFGPGRSLSIIANLGESAEPMSAAYVAATMFPLLRAQPILGRNFTAEEDEVGAPDAVILSHGLWQNRFGSDSETIGQTITINDNQHTIVGVMPPGFSFPSTREMMWLPMARVHRQPGAWNYQLLGRIKDGLTREQAETQLSAQTVTFTASRGREMEFSSGQITLHQHLVGEVRSVLLIFMGAVIGVLLIACINVVNLTLTRATGREKEHVIRAALGAGRARLAQQLFTESTLVSLVGGGLGLMLAVYLTDTLVALSPVSVPRQEQIGVNAGVLVFTFGIAALVGLVVGFMPARRASRANLIAGLSGGSRGSSGSVRHGRLRDGLVVAQVALALILLVSAGLLLQSFYDLVTVEHGFTPENVLTFQTRLPQPRYEEFEAVDAFHEELLARIRALPGVRTAALALYLPYTEFWWYDYEVEGEQYEEDQEPSTQFLGSSPGYFESMGIAIIRGRDFAARDRPPAPGAVIVNELLARRHWPDGEALGKRIRLEESEDWVTIIGVAADTRHRRLNLAPTAQIYVPFGSGEFAWGMPAVIRTDTDPNALIAPIRQIVSSIDPDIALTGMMSLRDRLSEQVAEPRFRTLLIGTFGFAALALAVIGVYGVMAYAVAQRTREVGIRKALGANRGRILRDVVARGLILTLVGLALGLAGAYVSTTLLESYLYELDVHDPATFALAALVLLLAAILAATLPARRAARVDPVIALRAE